MKKIFRMYAFVFIASSLFSCNSRQTRVINKVIHEIEHASDQEGAPITSQNSEDISHVSNVPKPQKRKIQSMLPFDPSGCPCVFIKGSDTDKMVENKLITANIYGRDYTFTLGADHPNGTKAVVACENYGVNLINDLLDDDTDVFFDEFGDLNENCNMQLTTMDFNNDDECEVLFTLQSEDNIIMKTYVFKLLPHPYRDLIVKYLGFADGQFRMYVDGTNIIAPYGSQGLYKEYMLVSNGKFININQ